jgi:hypothetical protein
MIMAVFLRKVPSKVPVNYSAMAQESARCLNFEQAGTAEIPPEMLSMYLCTKL